MQGPMGFGLGMMLPNLMQPQNAVAGVPGAAPITGPTQLDFSNARVPSEQDLATSIRSLGEKMGWTIQQGEGGSLQVAVPLAASRRQRVFVELNRKDQDGNEMIGIWSPCGAINPAAALTILRNNDSVVHGAFAMKRIDEGEILVLKSNVLSNLTNSSELAKIISAVAWQADEVEQQLSGSSVDHH